MDNLDKINILEYYTDKSILTLDIFNLGEWDTISPNVEFIDGYNTFVTKSYGSYKNQAIDIELYTDNDIDTFPKIKKINFDRMYKFVIDSDYFNTLYNTIIKTNENKLYIKGKISNIKRETIAKFKAKYTFSLYIEPFKYYSKVYTKASDIIIENINNILIVNPNVTLERTVINDSDGVYDFSKMYIVHNDNTIIHTSISLDVISIFSNINDFITRLKQNEVSGQQNLYRVEYVI